MTGIWIRGFNFFMDTLIRKGITSLLQIKSAKIIHRFLWHCWAYELHAVSEIWCEYLHYIILTAAEDPVHLGSLFCNYTIYMFSYCLQFVSLYLGGRFGVITSTRCCAQFDFILDTRITNGGSFCTRGAHSAVGLFIYLFICLFITLGKYIMKHCTCMSDN